MINFIPKEIAVKIHSDTEIVLSEIKKHSEIEQKTDKKPEKEEIEIQIFQFNEQLAKYEQLELDKDVPLYELLDPDYILLFVDRDHYRVWIWQGSNTPTRIRFTSAKLAPQIRDKYAPTYKLTLIEEGNEPDKFKKMLLP